MGSSGNSETITTNKNKAGKGEQKNKKKRYWWI